MVAVGVLLEMRLLIEAVSERRRHPAFACEANAARRGAGGCFVVPHLPLGCGQRRQRPDPKVGRAAAVGRSSLGVESVDGGARVPRPEMQQAECTVDLGQEHVIGERAHWGERGEATVDVARSAPCERQRGAGHSDAEVVGKRSGRCG